MSDGAQVNANRPRCLEEFSLVSIVDPARTVSYEDLPRLSTPSSRIQLSEDSISIDHTHLGRVNFTTTKITAETSAMTKMTPDMVVSRSSNVGLIEGRLDSGTHTFHLT